VSSIQETLSVWIDVQLQKVLYLCPAYLKDSWHFLDRLKTQATFPADASIFTVDAVAMYSNINTYHALYIVARWLELHSNDIPSDFPTDKVLKGLFIIMKSNVFTFGNRFWLQRNGTAMGTSCACAYATIYYSFHEEMVLLNNPHVSFYVRLIDDALVILSNAEENYAPFVASMNDFGPEGKRLEWEAEPPGLTFNFLDLTVTLLLSGAFSTSTFQKPMNLYLVQTAILCPAIQYPVRAHLWHPTQVLLAEHGPLLFRTLLQAILPTAASPRPHSRFASPTFPQSVCQRRYFDMAGPVQWPPDAPLSPFGPCPLHSSGPVPRDPRTGAPTA
jgi:hypothetical protein